MIDAWRLILQGWPVFSTRGRMVFRIYSVSIMLLGVLDAAALYLLASVFQTGIGSSSGEITVDTSAIRLSMIIGLFVSRSTLSSLVTWLCVKQFAREETRVARNKLAQLLNPHTLVSENPSSDFYGSVERGPRELVAVTFNSATLFAELITGFVIVLALLVFQPVTAIIAFLYFAFIALLQHRLLARRSAKYGNQSADQINAVYRLLGDGAGLRRVLTKSSSQSLMQRLEGEHLRLTTARGMVGFLAAIPRYFLELVFALGLAVIGGLTYWIFNAPTAFAATTLFIAAGFRLLPIVNRVQSLTLAILAHVPTAKLALHRFVTLMPPQLESPINMNNVFEMADVSYSYPDTSQPVLEQISLQLQFGKQYAIVGPSGAGKTTLADILLGLNIAQSGTVRLRCGTIQAYVPQQTFVASLSLAENVALSWKSEAIDLERVRRALMQAKLTDFVIRIDDPRPISGEQISGGQRQRLGLARAFYAGANFIVLDEVTSALDVETERDIYDAINSLRGTATVIIIAHRLSTVQRADSVFYLDNGRLAGTGTFAELSATLPQFQRQIQLSQIHVDA